MSVPLKVIDRDSALEARIDAEYRAMLSAADGNPLKAMAHYQKMVRLCGMRSKEFIERREREMGLR